MRWNCITHALWCMSGSLPTVAEKCSRHSGRVLNTQFYVSGKRPIYLKFTQFPRDGWENILLCLIIIIKSEVWTIIHCLWLGHETMVYAVCLFIFLWSCDMAGLLRGTFVSWWYLPPVTDMQHYYHARYPTDDWHLASIFSLVYFSVEVCLVGVFPHSVSI